MCDFGIYFTGIKCIEIVIYNKIKFLGYVIIRDFCKYYSVNYFI